MPVTWQLSSAAHASHAFMEEREHNDTFNLAILDLLSAAVANNWYELDMVNSNILFVSAGVARLGKGGQ